ncbi:MAG: hypothetical protein ACXV7C_05980 [Candidatus Angelobacter sp.]
MNDEISITFCLKVQSNELGWTHPLCPPQSALLSIGDPPLEEPMKPYVLIALLGLATISTSARTDEKVLSQSEPGKTQASGAPAAQADTNSTGSFRPGAGTVVVVELLKAVDAKKSSVGDQIECVVRQDLLFKGKIIIPRDSRVTGHITEAIGYTKEHSSRLGMLFEKVVLKDKTELPFQYPAVIEAVASPVQHTVVPTSRLDQMPVQMEKGKSTGGAALDAVQSNPNIMGANFPQTTGVISAASRGVVGLKDLTLEKSTPEAVTIVGDKRDVRLVSHTQMVLRVIDGQK